jgi:phenylacetate-CoA ligase
MKFQYIYDHSPIFFQNLMTSVYGYSLKRTRYGKYYHEHMQLLNKLHSYSKEQLQAYQFEEMMKLLRYVNEHSKFYNELYKNLNIEDIKAIEDIKKLPIVTKEMLRKNIEDVITIPKKGAVADHTGGTTGKSLIVYNRVEDIQKRMAVLDFFKLKNGFENVKMKKATFMGKHIVPPNQKKKVFWRYNKPIKQMLYSSFHLTEENIPYYIDSLNDFKPVTIDGFASSIYEIAFYIKRKNVKLKFQPKVIFPTSETLTEDYRKTIEEVFNCNVRDQYASSEGAPFVWECEYGNLHYDITTGVIENIDNSNEVLVTSFLNYGTPLIRYKIGDSMIFEDSSRRCKCGFNTPLVKSIEGRKVDYLYSTKRAKINLGNVSNIFKNVPNTIIKAQLIQDKIDHLIVKIVVDNSFSLKHKDLLIDEIKHKFGNDMKVDIEIVDEIPREKSGKHRLIVNKVEKNF